MCKKGIQDVIIFRIEGCSDPVKRQISIIYIGDNFIKPQALIEAKKPQS